MLFDRREHRSIQFSCSLTRTTFFRTRFGLPPRIAEIMIMDQGNRCMDSFRVARLMYDSWTCLRSSSARFLASQSTTVPLTAAHHNIPPQKRPESSNNDIFLTQSKRAVETDIRICFGLQSQIFPCEPNGDWLYAFARCIPLGILHKAGSRSCFRVASQTGILEHSFSTLH
jgi:hypothetical protein